MVSIIACTNRDHSLENVLQNYERQLYAEKELIIVLNDERMDINRWKQAAKAYKDVTVYQLPQHVTLGECYNFAIPKARYSYIAKFDDDDYYSPYYLSEAMKGFEVSGASVVGKSTIFIYYLSQRMLTLFHENHEFISASKVEELFTKYLVGATLVFRKDLFPAISFEHINVGEDTKFLRACLEKGVLTYSTSRYNYVYIRYPRPAYHTSKFQEYRLFEKSRIVKRTKDFHGDVTVNVARIFKE